jgi:sugar-specific transcriptional regulator TrmB
MLLRRRLLVVFTIWLFSVATLDAQPYSDPFGPSTILERPILNLERNHCLPLDAVIAGGDDRNPPPRLFTAQTYQPDDPQIQQTQENMSGIRERLEARIQALEAEWAAIKKEEAEINRIVQGGTLRGSNTKKFMKRTDDFSQRVMKYNTEKETLRKDIEAFETAVKNAAIAPLDTDSEDPAAKAAQTKAYLEKKREELTVEYRALKQEKQRIGRPDQTGPAADNLPTVNQQASQWNEKMKEFAKKRKTFNEAVQAFNEKTGQNVQPLPEP